MKRLWYKYSVILIIICFVLIDRQLEISKALVYNGVDILVYLSVLVLLWLILFATKSQRL